MTLTDFMLARIAEDEAVVREVMATRPAVELWTAPLLRAGRRLLSLGIAAPSPARPRS